MNKFLKSLVITLLFTSSIISLVLVCCNIQINTEIYKTLASILVYIFKIGSLLYFVLSVYTLHELFKL